MLRRLIHPPIRQRITLAVLALVVTLALSIESVYTNALGDPGLTMLFRGRAVAAIGHRPGTRSFFVRVYWMGHSNAIHNVVNASVGGINYLEIGPASHAWCGT